MTLFLQRADFELACANAGITDLVHDGEGYSNPATQATYQVWLSVARPSTGKEGLPVVWLRRRAGRGHSICFEKPPGPGSSSWPALVEKGWDSPMPMFCNVPSVSPSIMAVVMEHLRRREEGGSAEQDRKYTRGELARAAACYAFQASGLPPFPYRRFWPWPDSPMKNCSASDALIIAGAFIFADLERRAAHGAE